MKLTAEQQEAVLGHLIAADFELRVASGFECIKGTAAHDNLKSAVQQAQCAMEAVKQAEIIGQSFAMRPPTPAEELPMPRKQRLGYRAW